MSFSIANELNASRAGDLVEGLVEANVSAVVLVLLVQRKGLLEVAVRRRGKKKKRRN